MYLQRLELKNSGPIKEANLECRFNEDGSPKPIVLVGQNGSGKSIATAHIVNALIGAHSTVFKDSDVEAGSVYKLRSPGYVKHGAEYSVGQVNFSNDLYVLEAQFMKPKSEFVAPFPRYSKWEEVDAHASSHFHSNFRQRREVTKAALNNATHLFFPPNRFEEPAWLNDLNLRNKVNYASLKRLDGYSNRPIVNYAPMRDLQSWLLDLIYDVKAVEKDIGPASKILEEISTFLKELFGKTGDTGWSIGIRSHRQIGLTIGGERVTSNLFQLSTGQAILLDLFLTVIRDFDLSYSPLQTLNDIEGMVIVDEIDLHLHTDLQHDLLPKLIGLFPRVQFILTTHSPLFLVGMKKNFLEDGFQIIELPSGQEIEVERFSEFETAYRHMQESSRFEEDVRKRIEVSHKPQLYLEGTTDKDYLSKAAEILGKTELFDRFELVDSVGAANLKKVWDAYKGALNPALKNKLLLLYDCDVKKDAAENGNIFRRVLPKQDHKICSGIENLFPDASIERAKNHKLDFIDVDGERVNTERGVTTTVPETWKVNKDEKRNLCDWFCENGTADDFGNFSIVFEILEDVLSFEETTTE